ncbi:DUF1398 family protein [Undibacterium flavidum]|uniref:DUF1398 family protein n=1 Tax=Undibacterium flavidum TaxID=2762297 RepID=A0ABR6Y908_9BURK|nr:DUF1398 family protein [Undibacterium flavidum]MBC3873103.1 DUF1398 family protein [Undibacterium flavidum]
MNAKQNLIRETFEASQAGSIHFGQVIGALMSIDVESYFVDYRTRQVTYYFPSDENFSLNYASDAEVFGQAFVQADVKAAIVGAQKGEVMYPEFKKLTQKAGCIGYFVWIKGRHVSYLGRNGETHVEHFPN